LSSPRLLAGIFVAAVCACGGCPRKGAQPDAASTSSGVDLTYWISAARPQTNFRLRLPPSGVAELELWAAPPYGRGDVLGRFREPVATYPAVVRYVRDHGLIDHAGGASATAEGSGAIELSADGKRAVLGLAAADEDVNGLRKMLDAVANSVAQHPIAAVRLTVTLLPVLPAQQQVTAVVSHVGVETLGLIWRDSAAAAPRVWATVVDAHGGELSRLAPASGSASASAQATPDAPADEVPVGVDSFGPGRALTFRFPPTSLPAGAAQIQVHVSASVPLGPVARTNLDLVVAGPVK
jgi:hypothetical protein